MNNQTKDGPPVQSFFSPLRSRRGFSMVELLIVVGIVLAVSAISLPTVTRSVRAYRINGAAANVSGSLQLARFNAIRLNRSNPPLSWRKLVQGNLNVLWADLNNNGVADATEPQQSFSTELQFLPAGTAPSVASMGYANTQISPAAVAFDSRGSVSFGGAAPVVYVFVLGIPNRTSEGFSAVSVMPTGKTQMWRSSANGPWQKR